MPENDETARLRVVSDDPSSESELREPLAALADGRQLELKVVAPIRPASGLDLLTGDVDDSIADALAGFEAERIVLVDPDEDLAEAARQRFELPVSVLGG